MVAAITPLELTTLVIVVVVSIIVIALLLYTLRRLKERRAQLLGELRDRPEFVQDRAFNRIAMARREADVLARQGSDVSGPREQIAQAQAAFDSMNYDRAYELAQQAHEKLVNARSDGRALPAAARPAATPVASPSPAPRPSTAAVVASAASLSGIPAMAAVPSNLPKNRVESQFQLRLLDQDLDTARSKSPSNPALPLTQQIRADAGTAFDRGDYTEAFRLALRGRRTIGGSVESLPPATVASASAAAGEAERPGMDAGRSAEIAAGAERCAQCGYPALPGDSFCRGCGEPRASVSCPQCGAARQPADTFCGRCGSSFR